MLNARLAADLVDRLSAHIDFNINIMDDRGVIVASRDRNRIGDFHAAAYRIVTGDETIEVLHADDSLPPGVKPGVNLPILHRGKTVGVVGVTGNPRDVLNVAYAVKTSVESVYEYEMYKERMARRQGIKNLFQNLLLYEEGDAPSDVYNVAKKLGYSDRFYRVPVLFRFEDDVDVEEVLRRIKNLPLHTRQDISFVTVARDILVFKTVDTSGEGAVAAVRRTVSEYAAQLREADRDAELSAGIYVGSLQRDFRAYRKAVAHAQWVMSEAGTGDDIRFFNDHVYRYIRSTIPTSVFESIFEVVVDCAEDRAGIPTGETIDALLRGNMSVKEAAHLLGVHRNTMRARMERIGRMFGIDPLNSAGDREFLMCLNEYLKIAASDGKHARTGRA